MFRQNTAAFIHELPAGAISNVDGDSDYVRVQVLTNSGALDREKQVAVVGEAHRAGRQPHPGILDLGPHLGAAHRGSPMAAGGCTGHAHTNGELIAAARAEIASLSGS